MNESITIEFRKDGQPVPIRDFNVKDGVILGDETSAWPLAMAIGISPASPITAKAMDLVRQRKDWEAPRYQFNVQQLGGKLRVHGVDPTAMPAGRYKVSTELNSVRLKNNQTTVDIRENGTANVAVEIAPDRQRFEFVADMIKETDPSARVLGDAKSVLDGQPVKEWLKGTGARIQRKACLLNLLAMMRCTPDTRDSLCSSLKFVFFCDVDRMYAALDSDLRVRLLKVPNLTKEGPPKAAVHAKMLERIPGRKPEEFRLESFRIGEFLSMQLVLALPKDPSGDDTVYADIDIDLGNPLSSIGGLVVHLGELLNPNPTDHLEMFPKLQARAGMSDFLYYKLSKTATA
ncbi:MAG: hypothetical protein IT168_15590 [Bryobacterales bacterium]|nr:hypothetical protein [Bryobacterales bacterium]